MPGFWNSVARIFDRENDPIDRIIVGLGNPGERYAQTRHNIGFMVLDALAREASGNWNTRQQAKICRTDIAGCRVLLVEPLTYMNRSGDAVAALGERFGCDSLLALLDDLSLPLGRIRVRERGSAGGHHGLESIMEALGTDEIVRVRLGIGEENMPKDKASYVLSDFPLEKQAELDGLITKAGDAVKSILKDGVAKTMSIFNAGSNAVLVKE